MKNQIETKEIRILLNEMIKGLHLSNEIIAKELDKNRRLEKALSVLMLSDVLPVDAQIAENNKVQND